MKKEIEKFLAQFPKNASSWAQATDEVRDLARESREHLEDYEGVIIEPLNFPSFSTPAEWNTKGRDYIIANFERMQERTKKLYYERFCELFVDPD